MAGTAQSTPGASDTTAIAYQLKRVYGDMITDLFASHTMTYNQFIKSDRPASTKPGGVGYYFATRQADIESVGARLEGNYLPEPIKGEGVQGYITPKLVYATLRLSGLAIEAGKSDVQAFVNAQGDATMSAYRALTVDLNRQCWGDGFGAMATLNKDSDSLDTNATWTVFCSNDVGVRYLRKGMIVDFFDSGGTLDSTASSQRIASIDNANKRIEMEYFASNMPYRAYHPLTAARSYTTATGAVPSGAVVTRYGARAAATSTTTTVEITGMEGLFDDGTDLSVFEGITVANDPEWIATLHGNSSVNRELSMDLMLALIDAVAGRAAGNGVDTMWMGLGQRRKYYGLMAPDVRYTPGEFLGGYERLTFSQNGQIKIIVDPMCRPNKIYMAPINAIKRYELTPIGWGGFDPNKMHWRQDYDEATMFLRTYTQLGVENRRALGALEDLVEPGSQPF